MAEKLTDFRLYAGRVVFPRTPDDLTATDRCPACHTALTQPICTSCGLDLRHPLAAELLAASQDAAGALDRRLELIGRIRYETEWAATAQAPAVADAMIAQPAPAPVAPPASLIPEHALIPEPTLQPVQEPTAPSEPKRSSIQVLLVVVGVSLLSIAAIFFLVYAFITWGLLARSIIIGAITIAAIAGASALRRRRLPATAEGVSVFAIVLLYLDAFALRGNDLLGAGATDARAYWGWTLIITAIGFVAWGRLARLRTPGIAGFAAFAPGVGLVAVAASSADSATTTFVFAIAVALAAGVHRFASRLLARPATAERFIAAILSAIGLAIAGITAFFVAPDFRWGATIALLMVAAIAALQIVLFDYRTAPSALATAVGAIAAVIGAVAITAALPAGVYRSLDQTAILVFPLLIGSVVALMLEALARQARGTHAALHSRVAAISSAITTAFFAIGPIVVLLLAAIVPPAVGLGASWSLSPTDRIAAPLAGYDVTALATVAGAALLAAGGWWFGGIIRRRLAVLVWVGCALLVLGVSTLPSLWLLLTGWEAIAFAAVIAVTVTDVRSRLTPATRAALLSTAFAASALAYATSWASMDTWQLVTLAVILVLLASRLLVRGVGRSALLGVAVVLFVIMGAAGARDLALPLHPSGTADLVNVFRATGFVGILMLGLVSLLRLPAIRSLDRRVVFWISATVITVSTAVSQTALLLSTARDLPGRLLPEHATSAAVSVFLVAALLCWAMARTPRHFRVERLIAVGALPLSLYWFVDSLVRALGADDSLIALAPATAAVLGAATSLALVGTRLAPTLPRMALDAGVVLVGLAALVTPALVDADSEWLALVISSVTVLLLAIDQDGLFGAVSRRKHLGWLALGLASAGLWQGLAQADVRAVEPYVLPVAGALLLIAGLSALRSRASETLAIPGVLLGGLLLAIVPEAIVGSSGSIARPIIVGALCAALVVGASLPRARGTAQHYLDATALAAALGVGIVAVTQGASVLNGGGNPDARLEFWLVPGIAAAVIATVGQGRGDGGSSTRRRVVAQAGLAAAIVTAVALELPALHPDAIGFARAATLTVLLGAALVLSIVVRRAPLTVAVGWLGFALAAIVGATALVAGAFGELELVTVPLAAALIAAGSVHLRRVSSARTWPALAPGVALALVPSLVITALDAPLWRLVGLGVVAIAVLVVSLVLRLQAPLVISAIVLLAHAIATFAPEIAAVYQAVEWWLWLAIGGVIVLVISIRFESSRRGVKAVVGRIAALR